MTCLLDQATVLKDRINSAEGQRSRTQNAWNKTGPHNSWCLLSLSLPVHREPITVNSRACLGHSVYKTFIPVPSIQHTYILLVHTAFQLQKPSQEEPKAVDVFSLALLGWLAPQQCLLLGFKPVLWAKTGKKRMCFFRAWKPCSWEGWILFWGSHQAVRSLYTWQACL